MFDNDLEIKVLKDHVIIRTVDNIGFPIDIWRFDKNNLSKNESLFIENMLSMAESMTASQDKQSNK